MEQVTNERLKGLRWSLGSGLFRRRRRHSSPGIYTCVCVSLSLSLFLSRRKPLSRLELVVKLALLFQAPTAGGSNGEFVNVVRQNIAQQKQQVMQTAVELERVKNEVESFSVEFYNLQEENLRLEAAVQTHGEQG